MVVVYGFGLLPRSDKKTIQLGGDVVLVATQDGLLVDVAFLPELGYAMVVSPEPAWPVSQKTHRLPDEESLAHLVISWHAFRPCMLTLQSLICGRPSQRDANVRGPLSVQSISVVHKPANLDTYLDIVVYQTRCNLDADRHFDLGTTDEHIHNLK
jgi:hypothetical protein